MIPSPWHRFLRSLSSLVSGRPVPGRPFRKKAPRRARLGIERLEDRLVPAAVRDLAGFTATALPPTDDGSTALVALGFDAGFFGTTYSSLYVNNNGNVTFDDPLGAYPPFDLTSSGVEIIAPFFADVDTRGLGSGVVTYGQDTLDGHAAFGVNWIGVGYFGQFDDRLNSFQLVLIDRSDIAPGAFDIEFNYDQIEWELGGASDGISAWAGYAGGVELAGSGVNGAFLDDNTTTGLIHSSLNSAVLGRYVFEVRGAGGNQAPVAAEDSYGVDEDGTLDVAVAEGVLSNDSDLDEDVLTAALVTDVEHGALVLQEDGSFAYTPEANWFGTDSFTYQVSDGNGGTATATVTLTVNPVNDAPVLMLEVPDQLATEDEPFSFTFAENSFADVDAGDTLTYTAAVAGGGALPGWLSFDGPSRTFSGTPGNEDVGVLSITVTATDAAGASATDTFDLTVTNANDAPVLDPIGNRTIEEGSTLTFTATASDPDVPANTLTFTLEGNVPEGASIDPNTGEFTWTPTEAQGPAEYTFTVRVTDDGDPGLFDEEEITVAVNEVNDAPVVDFIGDQNSAEGEPVEVQASASDPEGSSILFGAIGLPAGLAIDSTTGLISGTLTYLAAEVGGGVYTVTVSAYDSAGVAGTHTFQWTVQNVNTTPVLDSLGDRTNFEGDAVAYAMRASDADGDSLTYSATGLPDGLSINANTGLISGVIGASAGAGSPYLVTVTVSDGNSSHDQSFTWTVPHVVFRSVGNQRNLDGDVISLPVIAWAPGGQTLTYSAAGLPTGLSIDSATGIITGTIDAAASTSSPYTVTVTATDGVAPADTTFSWEVSKFTLLNPGNQGNAEGEAVVVPLRVSTITAPSLTFSADGLPDGLAINPTTGLIAGTLANLTSNDGPYSVTVSATDGTSTSSQTFTWIVTHISIASPGLQINAPDDVVSLSIEASDPEEDPLTYSATGLPAGLDIDTNTGVISGTIASTAGSATPYSVTVTVSDGSHTATETFAWSVSNGVVPVQDPGTQTSAEGDAVSLQIDASGGPLSFQAVGLPAGLAIDFATGLIAGTIADAASETSGGVYQVTVLADNGQGGTGSTTFTWNVSHTNLAPVLFRSDDQLNGAGDGVSLPVFAYDLNADTLTYSATGLPAGLAIDTDSGVISGTVASTAGSGTPYSVTVTVSDGTLDASQTFAWFVTASPVILTSPSDQTDTEGDTVSLQLSASGSGLTYQADGLPDGLSIDTGTGLISGTVATGAAADGPYFVTITATDIQGDSSGQQFVWYVEEVVQPLTLTNPGPQSNAEWDFVELPIEVSHPDLWLSYTASGLPIGLWIHPISGVISGTIDGTAADLLGGAYTVTVYANDDAGNTASATFTWTVTDVNTAPWLAPPSDRYHRVGDMVSLQLEGGDWDLGQSVVYSATGLPAGLSINTTTGLISGTISAAPGSYAVTVSASDGSLSTSQQSTWEVVSASSFAPQVTFAINGTTTHRDDVFIWGSEAIPVVVTLQNAGPGLHSVELSAPGGLASFDETVLLLANGASATVLLTALQLSAAEDDVLLVAQVGGQDAGKGKLTILELTLPGHVRAANTPERMKDRIPDVNPTSFDVELSTPLYVGGARILLKVTGQSADNGTVKLIGTDNQKVDELVVRYSTPFRIVGETQTEPTADGNGGNAGKLHLEVVVGMINLVMANGFAVAPIPTAVKASNAQERQGIRLNVLADRPWFWGVEYKLEVQSDGGALDKVFVSEDIHIVLNGGGIFNEAKSVVGDWVEAAKLNADFNGLTWNGTVPLATAKSDLASAINTLGGSKNEQQVVRSYTAALGKPKKIEDGELVKNSGFWIGTFTSKDPARLRVQRKPWALAPGAGIVDKTAAGEKNVPI